MWVTVFKHRSSSLWVVVVMWGSALVIVAFGFILTSPDIAGDFLVGDDATMLLALSVVLIGLAMVPFVVGKRNGPIDWFAVIYVVAGAYVLNFALRLMYLMATGTTIGILPYWDTLVEAMTYVLMGFGAMLLGYYVAFGDKVAQWLPSFNLKWQLSPSLGKVAILYIIGFGARFLLSLEIVSSTYLYYFIALSYLTPFVLAISIINALVSPANRGMWRAFVLVLLPLQLLYALVWSSGKFALIEPVYILLICYHYLKGRLPFKLFVPAALIIVGVIFPIITVYRGQSPSAYTLTQITNTMEDLIRGGWQGYSDLVIDSVMMRSHLMDSVALVVKYSSPPDVLSGIGEYMRIPLYAFLPRVFWSEKPIGQGVIFGVDYLGTTGMVSVGMSNPGDLYSNLGLTGLIVGMFVLGFIYRFIYEYFIVKHRGSPLPALVPYLFIYIFALEQLYLGFEVAVSVGISELIRRLVLLVLVVLYLRAPYRSAPVRYFK
jgi:hypothetical protein